MAGTDPQITGPARPESPPACGPDGFPDQPGAFPERSCGFPERPSGLQDWMDYQQIWPEWLESLRVPDAVCAEAYEQTPVGARAAIKTAMALAMANFGENSGLDTQTRHDIRHGIISRKTSRPADFALIVFAPAFRACARLAAACAPAILAGVQNVAALCLGGSPCGNALTTLELCGIEDIFAAENTDLPRLLSDLADRNGRLVILGPDLLEAVLPGPDPKTALASLPANARLACYVEKPRPGLRLAAPEAFDREILEFAQAGAAYGAENTDPASPVDAIYCTPDQARSDFADFSASQNPDKQSCQPPCHPSCHDQCLLLGPGCEGFWLHRGLGPEFFRVRQDFFALADGTELN